MIVTQATLRQLFASLTVTQCCPAANPVLVAVVVPFAHRKVYGAVPPEPATVAEPVDWPKQFTFTTVPELIVAVTALGSVKVTFAVAVQPLASVVVTRYVPAAKPLSVCVVPVVDHAKPYGLTPPAGFAVRDPSDEPKQLICAPLKFDVTLAVVVCAVAGCVIVNVAVAVQPLASLTVTVRGPAASPVAVCVNCPGIVLQLKLYAPVPPAPLAVAVPVDCPKHNTFVTAAAGTVTVTAAGAVMVVVDVAVQPRLSVTVTVYVPAPSPFKL